MVAPKLKNKPLDLRKIVGVRERNAKPAFSSNGKVLTVGPVGRSVGRSRSRQNIVVARVIGDLRSQKQTSPYRNTASFRKQWRCKLTKRRWIHVKSSVFGNETQHLHFLRTKKSDTVGRGRSRSVGRGRAKHSSS